MMVYTAFTNLLQRMHIIHTFNRISKLQCITSFIDKKKKRMKKKREKKRSAMIHTLEYEFARIFHSSHVLHVAKFYKALCRDGYTDSNDSVYDREAIIKKKVSPTMNIIRHWHLTVTWCSCTLLSTNFIHTNHTGEFVI